MGKKPQILLVCFEGIADTVIESAVFDHARIMREMDLADIEVWIFCISARQYTQALERQQKAVAFSGARVRIFRGVRPAIPGSVFANALILKRAIDRSAVAPDVIHARGDYTAAVCVRSQRKTKRPVLWDCRADTVSETEERLRTFSRIPKAVRDFKLQRDISFRRAAVSDCAGALFVSSVLRDMFVDELGQRPYEIVPCVASEDLFFYDSQLREVTRQALDIDPDATVFVFSGGLQPYQKFGETIDNFKTILRADPTAVLIVLTADAKRVAAQCTEIAAAVRIVSTTLVGVNAYLNAADFGYMLRDDAAYNHAASPTKFSEYCLAGLKVVMGDATRDPANIGQKLRSKINPDRVVNVLPLQSQDRPRLADEARMFVGRYCHAPRIAALYHAING